MANYWENVTRSRMGRRRLLQVGRGAIGWSGALALIGCGSDDGDGGGDSEPTPARSPARPASRSRAARYGTLLRDDR